MPGHVELFSEAFLRAHWATEYAAFSGSSDERELLTLLENWASRQILGEKPEHGTFVDLFFRKLWGYTPSGAGPAAQGFTLWPEYPIQHSGQGGGTGFADLALGYFNFSAVPDTPQVLCEFKGIRSGLDAPQNRKGNDRSPVQQAADYLREASRGMFGTEVVRPTWAVVTDMNEFRLYWRDRMPAQYERFVLSRKPAPAEPLTLLDDVEEASFRRFLFLKLFRSDYLLNQSSRPPLELLLRDQGVRERAIENAFYREYRAYRARVYHALVAHNPGYERRRSRLVRLAQRFLDRCIFVLFCEDMGPALGFPQNLLRNMLIRESTDPHYDPDDTSVWHKVSRLFAAMRDGTPFGTDRINRFNGGLFDDDPDLEHLTLPNFVFCSRGQGASDEAVGHDPETLLYFSAAYNFGIKGTGERSIGLYTLGRIFEQSITELEFMEAEAEGRTSLAELSKRKRDGVYYTPEWVTQLVVRHTVGKRIESLRSDLGLTAGRGFSDEDLEKFQRATSGKSGVTRRRAPKAVLDYLARLDQFEARLVDLKVLDPACGSGAFLIQSMNELVSTRKWIAEERERITLTGSLLDLDALVKEVLANNIYGVDINPESVEITRLALWLHTAVPNKPLSALDHTIRCGNSLVEPDIHAYVQEELFDEERKDRVNAFDWRTEFAEVFERELAGFDCVVGNPPYVKLQNFKRVEAETADYLLRARMKDGSVRYRSTQTGNFDLYLPFIERGMQVMNASGRMGYIAPSLWTVNDYGAGLRHLVHSERRLETWVDFRDYQVFEEAITYTALQFFTGSPNMWVGCVFAPEGEKQAMDVDAPHTYVAYADLASTDPWVLAPPKEAALLQRLRTECPSLDKHSPAIVVGLQTSADKIYHLERVGPGRYLSRSDLMKGEEVEIEDGLMRPLISGKQAKRYVRPATDTYVLFPYDDAVRPVRLLPEEELRERFPKGWDYLRAHERVLRDRESGRMDRDDGWWAFGRSQNLDKQRSPKLAVAQTVPAMRVCFDAEGAFALNNVRVNGILPESQEEGWFLLGVLNGPVADFCFRRLAKPKGGGYFEANKQFIAPLPIPHCTPEQSADVARRAKALQAMHSDRRDKIGKIQSRLSAATARPRKADWLWEEVRPASELKSAAPKDLTGAARKRWAKDEHDRRLQLRLAVVDAMLRRGANLDATLDEGALHFTVDGAPAITTYVTEDESRVVLAQWRLVARTTNVTEGYSASKLLKSLLNLRWSSNAALRDQVAAADEEVAVLDAKIQELEEQLHRDLYTMYGLTEEECELVDQDWRNRPLT